MRSTQIVSACVATLVLPILGGSLGALGPAGTVMSSPSLDADRNRIFDTLDGELAGQAPTWTRSVIVLLNEPPTSAILQALRQAIGPFHLESNRMHARDAEGAPWTVVPGFATTLTKAQILALSQFAIIRQVEPVMPVQLFMDTARSAVGAAKAVQDFGVTGDHDHDDATSNSPYTTSDIVACVLDTGIDSTHPDFSLNGHSQVIKFKDILDPTKDDQPFDDHGHGTWVSGVLAGEGNNQAMFTGVAKGVALVEVKVTDNLTGPIVTNTTAVVDGINWCKDNKATYNIRIMSMSLGTLDSVACVNNDGTSTMAQAATGAWDAGIVVVIAAGNAGPGACTVSSPGDAKKVITVGAMTDPDNGACKDQVNQEWTPGNGWALWNHSGRGKTNDLRIKPEIVAPGVCITTTNWAGNRLVEGCNHRELYCTLSGTSLATPMVAGTVALMLDANPTLMPDRVKDILMSTAEDWGHHVQSTAPYGYDYGAGVLRAYEAVRQAAGGSGTPPERPNHYHKDGNLGLLSTDTWNVEVTNTRWPFAATLIVPGTLNEDGGSQANDTMWLVPPSGSTCGTVYGDTNNVRQVTISRSIASCGTGTYKLKIQNTGISAGDYWLDVSAGSSAPTRG